MRRARTWAVALVLAGLVGVTSIAAQEGGNSLDRARIQRLVQDLGSESADVREEATKELRGMGAAALPALKDALKSPDAEVSYRAQRLIEEIERGGKSEAEAETEPKDDDRDTRPQQRRPRLGRSGSSFSFTFGGPGQVSIQRDASGHIRVQVKENRDGTEVEEVYEADSVAEFIERYPEVARKYGITERGQRLVVPDLGNSLLGKEQEEMLEEWEKQLEEQVKEMFGRQGKNLGSLFDQLFKGLRGRNGGKDPWDANPFLDEDEEGEMRGLEDEDDLSEEDPAPVRPPKALTPRARLSRLTEGMTVEYLSPALSAQLGLEDQAGVLVSEVEPGGAAEGAGIRKYDVILKVNERPVRASLEFRRALKEAVDAGTLEFELIRKGETQRIPVTGKALEAFRK